MRGPGGSDSRYSRADPNCAGDEDDVTKTEVLFPLGKLAPALFREAFDPLGFHLVSHVFVALTDLLGQAVMVDFNRDFAFAVDLLYRAC